MPQRKQISHLLMTGMIFSSGKSIDEKVSSEEFTRTILFRSKVKEDHLPSFSFYTEIKDFPKKFLARVKEDADYVILSKETLDKLIKKSEAKSVPKKVVRRKSPPKSKPKKKQIVKREKREITFNYHILRNAVRGSVASFFFSGKESTVKDVSFTVASVTPWRNKYILKFNITNEQSNFFFISNISLFDKENNFINAQYFNEMLVVPGKEISGFALIPEDINKALSITLLESAGQNRSFSLDFVIP